MDPHTWTVTYAETLAAAAAKVASRLGVHATDPVILADGANVIVHLSPAPVVAKVAASTPAVRPDNAAWLQRELDVVRFLDGRGIPVMTPSPEVPPVVHHGDGQVMSFWRLRRIQERPAEATIGSMLRDLHAELRTMPAGLDSCAGPARSPRLDGPRILADGEAPAPPQLLPSDPVGRAPAPTLSPRPGSSRPDRGSVAVEHLCLVFDGSEDVDHIIIKIDAFENGSWRTKGTAVEYRPQDCTSDFPPI